MLDVCPRGARPLATTVLRLAPALTLALALAACIGPDLDSVGDYGGGLSPFAAASAPERPQPVQVFIASTRKGETGEAQREQAAEPHYALATMTVPPGHHAGSIEEPLWGRPNGRNDIALAGERELDDDEFHAELASHISGRIGVNRDVLVFVHGFNTSFDEARLRATQIAADAHFGGVMVLFTWPSKSDVFGYVSDKDSATASRDALQELLHDLGQAPGVGKVHVLAHSMGGWLSMEALRASAIAGDRTLSGHLGDVILASPDIDMTVFASQMARIRPANVTVFATPNDRALSLSSFIASSRQRVGAIDASKPEDRAEIAALGAKAVDISAYSGADRFINHTVFANSPEVIGEIGSQITAPRAEDAAAVSSIDASRYQDPNPAPSPVIAAPGSPAATAVEVAPLGPAGARVADGRSEAGVLSRTRRAGRTIVNVGGIAGSRPAPGRGLRLDEAKTPGSIAAGRIADVADTGPLRCGATRHGAGAYGRLRRGGCGQTRTFGDRLNGKTAHERALILRLATPSYPPLCRPSGSVLLWAKCARSGRLPLSEIRVVQSPPEQTLRAARNGH